jgi:deoxyribodipyrimidine photo-lyase
MSKLNTILLHKFDLRIQDNPIILEAINMEANVLPIFILSEELKTCLGGALKVAMYHSLKSLAKKYQELGLKLYFFVGDELKILADLIENYEIKALLYNRSYEPELVKLENKYKDLGEEQNLDIKALDGRTLIDFEAIKNSSGGYMKVYTPFKKKCLANFEIMQARADKYLYDGRKSKNITSDFTNIRPGFSKTLDDLEMLGSPATWNTDWQEKILQYFNFSEEAAHKELADFLENQVADYDENRNLMAIDGTSKLSPYYRLGLLSITKAFFETEKAKKHQQNTEGYDTYQAELLWREFAYYSMYHFPKMVDTDCNEKFKDYNWSSSKKDFEAWTKGETGYPIVDAAMKQLWETGWMHNRLRMIVGSFLTKDLHIDWREGAKWFEDTLFDADLQSNRMGWQWVAGSGFDASPFFRIFNPTTQSEKFDKQAQFITKWLPMLNQLDKKEIHAPYDKDQKKVIDYPKPICNHKQAREEALARYSEIK